MVWRIEHNSMEQNIKESSASIDDRIILVNVIHKRKQVNIHVRKENKHKKTHVLGSLTRNALINLLIGNENVKTHPHTYTQARLHLWIKLWILNYDEEGII